MQELRSRGWFGKKGKDGFIYRAWMKNQGIPDFEFQGRPVIGICNTWSELTPCNVEGRPASVRNRLRKFFTRSSHVSALQSRRSRIGANSAGMRPDLSRRSCRPVQSSMTAPALAEATATAHETSTAGTISNVYSGIAYRLTSADTSETEPKLPASTGTSPSVTTTWTSR